LKPDSRLSNTNDVATLTNQVKAFVGIAAGENPVYYEKWVAYAAQKKAATMPTAVPPGVGPVALPTQNEANAGHARYRAFLAGLPGTVRQQIKDDINLELVFTGIIAERSNGLAQPNRTILMSAINRVAGMSAFEVTTPAPAAQIYSFIINLAAVERVMKASVKSQFIPVG